MFNNVILIGRSDRTQKPEPPRTTANPPSSHLPHRKAGRTTRANDTRTEWHRVHAWGNLSKFARTLQKGQLVTLEGTLHCREVTEDIEGVPFKHRLAEIQTSSVRRLSKIESNDDPADGAGEE